MFVLKKKKPPKPQKHFLSLSNITNSETTGRRNEKKTLIKRFKLKASFTKLWTIYPLDTIKIAREFNQLKICAKSNIYIFKKMRSLLQIINFRVTRSRNVQHTKKDIRNILLREF